MRRSAGQSFKRFSSLITFVVSLLAFLLKSAVNASNELGRRLTIPLCEDSDEVMSNMLMPVSPIKSPSQLLKGNLCYRHSVCHASIATSHGSPNAVCFSGFRHSGTRTFGCNRIADMEL